MENIIVITKNDLETIYDHIVDGIRTMITNEW